MVTQQSKTQQKMYRQAAIEQSASPERLDQLVQVVSPKRWLSLVALGTLVTAGLAWSVLGRIPITVAGQGVLVYPGQVSTVQAPSAGRILALEVQVGEVVQKGQVLATIDQSELQKQLQLSRDKLAQLQQQDEAARAVQLQRAALERSTIAQQRQTLQQSLRTVQELTPILRERGLESIQRDRQALQQRLQTLQEILPTYEVRWRLRKEAAEQRVISTDMALQAQQEYLDTQAQIDQAESELKQLDIKEADAQQQYLSNVNQINELQAQIKALDTQAASQGEQDFAAAANRQKEMQDTQRTIAQLELQLQQSNQILSNEAGQIVELSVKPGQLLEPGMSIGAIAPRESEDASACTAQGTALQSVVFLPVSDGKRIETGMAVQVTPSIVKREEYGGIVGQVTEVSAFPVTQQGAASLVGNPDILPEVMGEGAHLAVFANLTCADTASGYRWSSSQGPAQQMTQGMTTSVRITVEERTPISYVLPILKAWAGGN